LSLAAVAVGQAEVMLRLVRLVRLETQQHLAILLLMAVAAVLMEIRLILLLVEPLLSGPVGQVFPQSKAHMVEIVSVLKGEVAVVHF
jgi:hypothetical protein